VLAAGGLRHRTDTHADRRCLTLGTQEVQSEAGAGPLVPLGLYHTGFTVTDLERSIAFYRLLGLEVIATQEKQGGYLAAIVGYPDAHVRMAHLRAPGSPGVLELFEYVTPIGQSSGRLEPRDTGVAHVCYAYQDLELVYKRLVDAGVDTFVSPPQLIDTGFNQGGFGLYLRDPDGIPVELFQPPVRNPA
jgi:catechol 2,3-dioxygenase-like lactoylglutathione lyase family enzyme